MRPFLLKMTGCFLTAFFLLSCENVTEEFKTEALTDFYPLQTGKYVTYRLDSTVFTNLGRKEEVHVYQEKNVVDAQITDNLGRTSFRMLRFLRDSAGLQAWRNAGTYMITPLSNAVEVTENNMRVIKLTAPPREGTIWKAYRYLADDPYGSQFTFSNDDYMEDWEFTIRSTNETLSLNGKTIPDILTVQGVDEAVNVPITDPRSYASRSYITEKYAKGIGLVHQELILWEYQPNTGGASPYKTGFGVKRTLLDHN